MKKFNSILVNLIVFTILFSFTFQEKAYAQKLIVNINQPPVGQFKQADLWNAKIINNSNETYRIYLYGTLTEKKAGLIATGTTTDFDIKKETKQIKGSDFPQTPDIDYPNKDPKYKEALIKTGSLPPGDYTYCLYAKLKKNNEELGNDCIDFIIEDMGMISLLTPGNEEEINTKAPLVFTWMSTPPPKDAKYLLRIVEIMQGQSPEVAFRINTPWFEKTDIKTNTFSYPKSAKPLEKGKKYAWGISLGEIISEIFTLEISELEQTGEVIISLIPTGNCCYKMYVWRFSPTPYSFSSFKFMSSNIASANAESGYSIFNPNLPTDFVLKTSNSASFPNNSNSFVGTVCFNYSALPIPITVGWSTDNGVNWTNRFDTTIVCTQINSCHCGSWENIHMTKNNTPPAINVQPGVPILVTTPTNLSFNPNYNCFPDISSCQPIYTWYLTKAGSGLISGPNYNTLCNFVISSAGTYYLSIVPRCNSIKCDSTVLTIQNDSIITSTCTCPCPNNTLQNWNFLTGLPPWQAAYNTPQYYGTMGGSDNGFISMWSNRDVGEGINQVIPPIVAGTTYRISFCARNYNVNPALTTNYVMMRIRLSGSALTNPTDGIVIAETPQITGTPGTGPTPWTCYTFTWTAPNAANGFTFLTASPFNNTQDVPGNANTVSWGQIDNICFKDTIISGDLGQCDTCGPCYTKGPELITNSNFDEGNTGFTSDLIFTAGTFSSGHYSVRNSITLGNSQWWACTDHTTGNPNGNFLACDYTVNTTVMVWKPAQPITVSPGQKYILCFWVNNLVMPQFNFEDPQIYVTINGTQNTTVTVSENPDGWKAISVTWIANVTTATIQIYATAPQSDWNGYDFALDDISFRQCIPITANAGPDLTVNVSSSVTLNGTGGTNCVWTPSTYLSNANICNPVFTAPGTPGTFTYFLKVYDGTTLCDVDTLIITVTAGDIGQCDSCGPCYMTGGDQVINGNFNTPGQLSLPTSSGLAYTNTGLLTNGHYSIRNSGNLGNPGWTCIDHTTGSPTGNFMVCDNSLTPGTIAWSQTVNVIKDRKYIFCAWVNNLVRPETDPDLDYPIINLWVDNTPIITPVTIQESPDGWRAITGTWIAGTNGTVTIKIFSSQNKQYGDDFAIDDISFTECKPITADAGPDLTVSVNSTVTLNCIGGTNCQWFPSTLLSNSNICNPIFTAPGTPGTFIYIVNTMDGTVYCDSDTLRITVIDSIPHNDDSCRVCVYKWIDRNHNGSPNIGEYIANQEFVITSSSGAPPIYVWTGPNGWWHQAVPCGPTYTVTEVANLPGYTPAAPLTGSYTLVATPSCPQLSFRNDTLTTQDSCHCNGPVNDTVRVTLPNGNILNLICGNSYSYNANLPITTTITLPNYICNPNTVNCTPQYNWSITGPNNSSGIGQIITQPYTLYGQYVLHFYVQCGNEICDTCTIPINITMDTCDCGKWNTPNQVIVTPSGGQPTSPLPCGSTYTHNAPNPALNIKFADYVCSPTGCTPSGYTWNINGAAVANGIGNSINYNFVNAGTYTVKLYATCGTLTCDSCMVIIKRDSIPPEEGYNCDQCPEEPPGPNLVTNEHFDAGNSGFTSTATYNNTTLLSNGQYDIVPNAVTKNSNWCSQDHTSGVGNFLVCDGFSNQVTVLWSQNITNIQSWWTYALSAWIRNIDCSPYANPTVRLRINGNWVGNAITVTVADGWVRLSGTWGSNSSTSATIEIVLTSQAFLGNDVGLDDICFQKLQQTPKQFTIFSATPFNVGATEFNVQANQPTPPNPFPDECGYYWYVCELDNNYNSIPGTDVANPSQWWTYPSTTFPGYNGTSNLSGTNPGKFNISKRYRITYGVWCTCLSWNSSSWIYDPGKSLRKGEPIFIEDKDYKIPPETMEKIIKNSKMK